VRRVVAEQSSAYATACCRGRGLLPVAALRCQQLLVSGVPLEQMEG
jgi:hypothetical protein